MFTCPRCGTTLELALRLVEDSSITTHAVDPTVGLHLALIEFVLAGRIYSLAQDDIYGAARQLSPSTILKYYVILPDSEGRERRFPIKQVVRHALQARFGENFVEKNFTAHRARDILRRLGFEVREA